MPTNDDLAQRNLAVGLLAQLPDDVEQKRRVLDQASELVPIVCGGDDTARAKLGAFQIVAQLPDSPTQAREVIETMKRLVTSAFGDRRT
jgi:hypothetical protein